MCMAAFTAASVSSRDMSAPAIVAECAAAWAGAGSASACGARHTAAATPAAAGTAALGRRWVNRLRGFFLWLPKWVLPERFALTGKAPQGACCLRSAWHPGSLAATRDIISQNGLNRSQPAKLRASCPKGHFRLLQEHALQHLVNCRQA